MSEGFVGFGDEDVVKKAAEAHKFKKGQTARIAIINAKKVVAGDIHYAEGVGYFHCIRGVCCEKLDASKQKFSTLITIYDTNKDGVLVENFGIKNVVVKPWTFSGDKFTNLQSINREFPLNEVDIKVTCVDEQFQKLTFVACRDSIYQKNKKIKAFVDEESTALEARLKTILGRELSAEVIREKLGLSEELPASEADDVDLGSIVDDLG